ncbi:MAG: type II secretion system F family protein [Candidatus Omnitrophica bacterium]|nr:type II secretion system F family protein [Candidatus Omnitrophota bacterium]
MHEYHYKAKNENGEFVEGTITATNETDAIKQLAARSIYPLSIKKTGDNKPTVTSLLLVRKKVSPQDLYTFTSQLAYLLKGGLPLLRGLEILRAQMKTSNWQKIIARLVDTIKQGGSFSEGLAQCKGVFNNFYVSMVRSGEAGGSLDKVLERLAIHIEKENDLRSKVLQALIYPSVIMCVGIITVMVIMMFVIPKMSLMYEELDQALPFITQALITVSTTLADSWWLVIGGIVVLISIINLVLANARISRALGRIVLNIPVFGGLYAREELVRFSRAMGMLLHNGVAILESFRIAEEVLGNAVFKTIVRKAHDQVQQGTPMSSSLGQYNEFPSLIVHLLSVGEETGTLDEALDKVADIYEKEVERYVKVITTLIEPFLILIIGGVVGLIAVAMFLPIFQLNLLAQ